MKINDLNGNEITVTDISQALAQTDMFMGLAHVNPSPEQAASDKERKTYWTDLHHKLLQLQSDLKETKKYDHLKTRI